MVTQYTPFISSLHTPKGYTQTTCSKCDITFHHLFNTNPPYCPNCNGAGSISSFIKEQQKKGCVGKIHERSVSKKHCTAFIFNYCEECEFNKFMSK